MKIYKSRKDVIRAHVKPSDVVLDVGCAGQAIRPEDPQWIHGFLKEAAGNVYGIDIKLDNEYFNERKRYIQADAENFDLPVPFDVIYAGELIEHLSNPGLFLDSCRRNLKRDGRLIITTPNAYNFFSLLEKIFKTEPSVNPDHTILFNFVVLLKLLQKNGWEAAQLSCIDTFRSRNSLARHVIYFAHRFVAFFTPKFMETLVVVATRKTTSETP